jgi:hypothetical protein
MSKFKGNVVTITGFCPFCNKKWDIAVGDLDVATWEEGEPVQNAFPYLSAEERESLISGMCTDCQKEIFG